MVDEQANEQIRTVSNSSYRDVYGQIQRLNGYNFLLDDIHPAAESYYANKQATLVDKVTREATIRVDLANIFLTSEKVEYLGAFSCLDRMLVIQVPKMNSQILAAKKRQLGELSTEFLSELGLELLRRCASDIENVMELVMGVLAVPMPDVGDSSLYRTPQHGRYLKITERLFCKYLCDGSEQLSCKQELEDALECNFELQSHELKNLG